MPKRAVVLQEADQVSTCQRESPYGMDLRTMPTLNGGGTPTQVYQTRRFVRIRHRSGRHHETQMTDTEIFQPYLEELV